MKSVSQKDEANNTAEREKGGIPFGRIILGAAVAVILYLLGVGPAMLMEDRGILVGKPADFVESIYQPMDWAYEETPFHKPIGLYLHLWSTNFDKNGEIKR